MYIFKKIVLACVYAYKHVHMCVCMFTYVCMCVHMYAFECVVQSREWTPELACIIAVILIILSSCHSSLSAKVVLLLRIAPAC